jgi:hypothetical protein
MTLPMLAQIFGLVGDTVTFIGAVLLARGEAGEEARAREIEGTTTTYKTSPELKKLVIEIEGLIIKREEDVEFAVTHRFSRRAGMGAWIIAGGFVLLLISRILEIIR